MFQLQYSVDGSARWAPLKTPRRCPVYLFLPPPFPRYWITNSAVHAQWSVVFAQLSVGGRKEGIHGFLVRIR